MGQKNLLTLFFSFVLCGLFAQNENNLSTAWRHIESNLSGLELTAEDIEGAIVNYQYTNEKTGITYIYINQAHKGIKVKNAIMNVTMKNGEVIHVGNRFIKNLTNLVQGERAMVKPNESVVQAANHLGVFRPEKPTSVSRSENGTIVYTKTNFTNSDITVEQLYDYINGEVKMVWQSTLDLKMNADYWEIRMDAVTGDFVSKNNLTVYCTHHKDKFKHQHDCTARHISDTQSSQVTVEDAISQSGTYRVYPLPAESPNHGSHELVVDPHYPVASPYGWHDTDGQDGAEFTITRGNNVFAYTDKDDDNSPDADVPQPDGGAGLVFDFAHDLGNEPLDSPDAAQVNLFYMNNMMHDLSFLVGFDEAAGNFQQRNYTGTGVGNDFVLAQAFDGFELATPSLNNANFSTPSDGSNGRMQMFLWQAPEGSVSVDEPTDLAGFYEYGTADFGGEIPAQADPPITGLVELVNDGDLASPTTGCKELENDLSGKIALIDRGLCFFSEKAYNAQTKGAIGAIICNIVGVNGGDGETVFGMTGANNAELVTIPTISFKKSDCDRIKLALSNSVDVVVTMHERESSGPEYIDGAFDNGVIAHEFGHGISNRLTGGPNAAGCLGNDEQMGEGWSDFFSLVLTVKEGDSGADARGIGTFAVGEPTDGRGIRRFPYSTDMSINPQTFDDIKGTTAPHPLGEVWVDCLWDMYWAFVDLYGFDADLSNENSGNHRAIRLVMEGMKIQPCSPGFIDGRDAILAGDKALYDGQHNCLIWDVFARRGVGFFADGGDSDDRNDGVENFESRPQCLEQLKVRKTATGFIEAGDQIDVELYAVNHIPQSMTGVVVTDEIPDGTTVVAGSASMPFTQSGNVITFELGDMAYEDETTITYKIETSSSLKSASLEYHDFEDGGEEWDVAQSEGFTTWTLSFDAFKSEETSFRIREEEAENDHSLISPTFSISGAAPALKFWHRYDTQAGVDGGFVQVSTDGGLTWKFTKQSDFVRRGYNTPIEYGTLAIPSLEGFTGSSNEEFVDSYLDLTPYVGQDIKVRFRYGSNEEGVTGSDLGGWFVDDVELVDLFKYTAQACISEATNTHGTCAEPTETIVNSDASTSIADLEKKDFGLALAPNPASTNLTVMVAAKGSKHAQLTISSISGTTVLAGEINISDEVNTRNIDISNLPAGIYVVKLQDGINTTAQKFVKQ